MTAFLRQKARINISSAFGSFKALIVNERISYTNQRWCANHKNSLVGFVKEIYHIKNRVENTILYLPQYGSQVIYEKYYINYSIAKVLYDILIPIQVFLESL